jgi:hypothetical protein
MTAKEKKEGLELIGTQLLVYVDDVNLLAGSISIVKIKFYGTLVGKLIKRIDSYVYVHVSLPEYRTESFYISS